MSARIQSPPAGAIPEMLGCIIFRMSVMQPDRPAVIFCEARRHSCSCNQEAQTAKDNLISSFLPPPKLPPKFARLSYIN